MTPQQSAALSQATGALGILEGEERSNAEELIALGKKLFGAPESATQEERARLLRLIEVLARRSSSAMPFAALGRSLSARLSGDERSSAELLAEFEMKLQLLGL